MRLRRTGGVVAAGILLVGLLLSAPQLVNALSPGVAFSADDLSTWQTNSEVYALGHSHGKVVVGGSFTQVRPPDGQSGQPRDQVALAVLDAETGEPDSCQFTLDMAGGKPSVRAIVPSDDGDTVYIGGVFSSIDGHSIYRAAALDVQSCTVLPFKTSSISGPVYGMAVHGDTLYLAGAFTSVAGHARSKFAAVDATSGKLLPWTADADRTGRAVAVSPDGSKVALGGDFFTVNGHDSHSIAIVDAEDGTNVRDYPLGFISRTSVTKTLWSGGDTLYAGNEGTGGGVFDGRFAIDWDSLDETWRDLCLGATQAVLEYRGTLYSANHAHDCSQNSGFADGKRSYFVAQDAGNAQLLGWNPTANDGIGEGIGARALTVATGSATGNDYLWAGGEFTRINGQPQQGLTRFGPDDVGAPPTPRVNAVATSDGTVQVRFRTVVDPDDSELTYRVFRDGDEAPIWEGTASSLWWKRPQVTVVDDDVASGESHSYRVTADDGTNTSSLSEAADAEATHSSDDYASAVRDDDPQLFWSYGSLSRGWVQDGSARTTKTDGLSGISEDGVSASDDGAPDGDSTGSVSFDGSRGYIWEDDYVQAPTTYSVETWIKTSTTSGGKIIGFGNGRPRTDNGAPSLSSNYDRHVYMTDSGRLVFGVWTGSAQTISTSHSYNDDRWHHVVATQGDDGMALYVDGERVGTNPETTAQSYEGVWHVGGDNVSGWPDSPSSAYFSGKIDETAVYSHALSPASVVHHYTAAGGDAAMNPAPDDAYGAAVYQLDPLLYWRLGEDSGTVATDSSVMGTNTGTYGSGVSLGAQGVLGDDPAATFDGSSSGSLSSDSSVPMSGDYSAELWFSTTSTDGGTLIDHESSRSGYSWNTDKDVFMDDSGRVVFSAQSGSRLQTADAYNDGDWHHVVAVRSGDDLSLYVDGDLADSGSAQGSSLSDGYWRVGSGSFDLFASGAPTSSSIDGTLDEVAVYSAPLPASVVTDHYSLGTADTTAPSAPQNLDASVSSDGVDLTWDPAEDDVGVTAYTIYRSDDPSLPISEWARIGDSTTESFTDDDAEIGTSSYTVVAVDAAGNTSDPADPATVEVADVEPPSAPTDVEAEGGTDDISLTWTPSTDDVGVDHYTVHRSDSDDVPTDPASAVGEVDDPEFTDTGLDDGTYVYRIVAVDAAGNRSEPSDAVSATVGPEPVTKTVEADADAMVLGVRPTDNYGTNTQLSSRGGSSPIESFLSFALPDAPDGLSLQEATLHVRTSTDPAAGSTDSHRVKTVGGDWSEDAITWQDRPTEVTGVLGALEGLTDTNTDYTADLDPSALVEHAGSAVTLRIDSSGDDNVRLWSSEARDSYRPTLELAYGPGAAPDPQADVTAPTAPSELSTDVDDDVTLDWQASTDDFGVAGYTVYRSEQTPVALSAENEIAQVETPGFTDEGLDPGTYHYVVTAHDAAGNVSDASNTADALLEQEPTVITESATQDAMVLSSAPDTNYGGNSQLASRGGDKPQESFLGFDVPEAPSGMELDTVTLTLRTSTDPVAASDDDHTCTLLTSPWDQDDITWDSRPTDDGVDVGEISDFDGVNTPYDVELDADAVSAHAGETITLRISSSGEDNLRLWSSDGPSPYAPALTFTFTPSG